MNDSQKWQAILKRDRNADGQFVFGVRTTRVYCRPSCPARQARREHIVFFADCEAAERAGFRACRRCHPKGDAPDPQAELMQQVAHHIAAHADDAPTLDELSEKFHLNANHLQKTFKRIIGVTPRQYAEAKRLEKVKTELKQNGNVSDALYNAGYGSSSRLYEKSSARLGMTPKTFQRGGLGMNIHYTIVNSKLGRLLVAGTDKGICAVSFGDTDAELLAHLRHEFPNAEISAQNNGLGEWVSAIVHHLDGQPAKLNLPLDVRGTAFQKRVWDALCEIPYGQTRSYGEIAKRIGQPNASRAVGGACNANRIPIVIPCHRVVGSKGELTGYRGGVGKKQKILAMEQGMGVGAGGEE